MVLMHKPTTSESEEKCFTICKPSLNELSLVEQKVV